MICNNAVISSEAKNLMIDKKSKSAFPQHSSNVTSDIAIIGLACHYPGANNVRELWENILARRVQFRRMLDQRLPLKDYYDEDSKTPEKTYVTKAAFLENFRFDWSKLRIPKKTFESTDIVHWLALDTALKAFEDAEYKIDEIPFQNTGVIVGNTLTGEQTRSQSLRLRWPYVQKVLNATLANFGISQDDRSRVSIEMEKSYKSAFYPITEDSLAGGLSNTIAGRICNYLNFKGGGYIVDGACSSSLLAVATAANALKMRDMDLALAGGVDVSLDPFELVGFAKVGALAKDKMSVYDVKANGFLPGEGCGFVVLKRLEDALRDHNYIYALIKGWGISSDGKGGIMEPSSSGQALAIRRAYKDAPYKVSDVDFIEGHGTGTTKGDRVELEGIAAAIKESANKNEKRSCGVTSFKSIVGHTKAAAGVGGLIKAILAVNQRILPPTANCQDPNEAFREKAKSLYPIIQGESLPQNKVVRAGISSAGFGGINCHVTIESKDEPSEKLKSKVDECSLFVSNQETEVFVFAARSINYLRNIIQRFKEDLRNISVAEMADLASLLSKKVKSRLPIKGAIVTDSPEHLYEALSLAEKELESTSLPEGHVRRIKSSHPNTHIILGNTVKKNRVGFLYPGQGSQRLNMTRRLVKRFDWARDLVDLSTIPLRDYIYKPSDKFLTPEDQKEFEKELAETRITQPAVILSSLIWDEYLSKLGIEPHAFGGHSLGELTAFYKAGAFTKKVLINFAELRGKLMATNGESPSGGMVGLFCSATKAQELVGKVHGNIVIANINSPRQVVVSGGNNEIEQVIETANKEKISVYRLNVSNAFHSSFMKEASERLKAASFLQSNFTPNSTGLYSSTDGNRITDKVDLEKYFARQLLSPVDFMQLIETMSKNCDMLIEVGPGRVLTDLVKAINKNDDVPCFPVESNPNNDRDLNVVLAELFVRNIRVHWEELYKNRLIRPFVPASRKKFIKNQCERPLKFIEQAQITPVEIKTREQVINPTKGLLGQEEEAEKETNIKGEDDIAFLLINLTHKMTGFDTNSISLDLRLLDDLNLDSIKAAELIGETAKILGVAGQVEPSQLSNNTLGQIRDRFQGLLGNQRSMKDPALSKDQVFKRYQHKTWVKNFVVEFEHHEITTKNASRLNFHNVLIVSDNQNQNLVQEIKKSFKLAKIQLHLSYGNMANEKLNKFNDIDCMIFVLPNTMEDKWLDQIKLKQTIEKLHKAIALSTQGNVNRERTVAFVQFGAGNFGDNNSLKNVESCCARSIVSTLHLERPDLRIRIIDFDRRSLGRDVTDRIINELQSPEMFSIAGYDYELKRKVPVYQKSEPVSYKKRNIKWDSEDVVLVTGGAKGITAECALEFARSTKAQMVLVGRSPVPIDFKDKKNEIVNTLSRFKEENLKCQYYQCNITDEEDVQKLIKEIRKKFGKIKGFIHGAGLNSLKRLKQATSEEVYHESLPKIIGALNILNAFKEESPALIMAITSVIGLTGMEGSGWYGFANEVLNLLLREFKNEHNETQVQTVAYSIWDDVGMGVRLGSVDRLYEKGIAAIPVDEGVRRFRQLAEYDPSTQQVIVIARVAGLDTWRPPSIEQRKDFRFIEDVKYYLPGVELIAQAHLNIQDDPYVLDHNWKGSLLFPFVFGLEAMTQAVAYVTDNSRFDCITIKDVKLERPIPVNPDSRSTIEIRAEVLQLESLRGPTGVKVEIYSEQTNYQQPHFSAVFEINSRFAKLPAPNSVQPKVKKVIDLDMQTDIYGPILFQGKMFQCIEQVHELYYNQGIKKGECIMTATYAKSTEGFLKNSRKFNNHFLIGDPFFIDSVLQSMQVIVPQDVCLPGEIEKIELISRRENLNMKPLVQARIKRIDADYYLGDAHVGLYDGFSVKIKNCRLKILDTVLSNPSANDLVNPVTRDQKIIENKLADLSKELDFVLPVIRCLHDDQLRNARKELRHKIEQPLLKVTTEELIKRDKESVQYFKVKWLNSGKPVVEGKSVKGVGVSVSHDGPFLIVVAGHGDQGCDVENIKIRSKDDWGALLGASKYKVMRELQSKGIDENLVGTAVWCAYEVLEKYLGNKKAQLTIDKVHKNILIFSCDPVGDKNIIAFPLKLTRGGTKIFSVAVKISADMESKEINNEEDLRHFKYGPKDFQSGAEYKDKLVFKKRFPPLFRQRDSELVTDLQRWPDMVLNSHGTINYQEKPVPLEEGKNSQEGDRSQTLLKKIGYNPEAFQLKLDYSGPQDQLVFIKSQPITFRTNKLQSKKVYFTSYFDWMGEIREQSANPIMEYLAGRFQAGNWGIATYSTKLEIFGELSASDILETHFWSEEVNSSIKGTYDLCIDWKKITPNQTKERVAFSRQRILWVKVVSWGVAQPEEMPNFIKEFMDTMKPRIKEKKPLEKLPQIYSELKKGRQIVSYNDRIKDKYLLSEKVINTTLEHSNLVGNIYFSNYAKWIGQVMESFFYKLIPEYYRGTAEKGEFVCTGCEINHLSEAMPFNDILVKMYVDEVYENVLNLFFDFYLIRDNEPIRKLAYAKYEAIWIKRIAEGQIQPANLPNKIMDLFLSEKL